LTLVIVLLALNMAACVSATVPNAQAPTDSPQPPTQTPTPTVVWFPPTTTPSPFPDLDQHATPTQKTFTEYGELIFNDQFNDPSKWSLGRTGSGSIALGEDELTLAVNRPDGYLYSLRQGTTLSDFYAEVTTSPTICRADDEYGLLLRISPGMDFYRFSLTCDGQVRVDKYYLGKASSPQPLTYSGQVPLGAPSSSILGVMAKGKVLDFYINNEYQFTIRDPSLTAGGLGVFARASGEDPVTINFSDLKVYHIND
jgi:hypothetical protein